MSYIKTEDGHVYDESKTVLSTVLGTMVIQVSDEIEPLLECFILRDGDGNQKIVEVCFDEKSGKCLRKDYGSVAYHELEKGEQLYGAVWQGNSLIAVARLNKGGWELL